MTVVADVAHYVLVVFLLLLFVRVIMEWVFLFARSFRPAGAVAVLLELCYSTTDPPLRALRKVVPPLRLGNVQLDLGILLLFVLVQVLLSQVVAPLRVG